MRKRRRGPDDSDDPHKPCDRRARKRSQTRPSSSLSFWAWRQWRGGSARPALSGDMAGMAGAARGTSNGSSPDT